MVFDNDKTIINILGCSFNKIDVPYFVRVNEEFSESKMEYILFMIMMIKSELRIS